MTGRRWPSPRALLLAILLAAAALGPARATDLPENVQHALRAAGVAAGHAAYVVVALDGGGLRVAIDAQQPMSPASTMKLVTTYVALQTLGPAFVWHTDVLAGAWSGDMLDGPLWLRGGGDPSLVIERFWLLVQRLRALGLREIRGDLVIDKSFYGAEALRSNSLDGDELRPYNVGPDPLLINFKAITYTWTPDPTAQVARVTANPMLAGLRLPPPVPLENGPCGDWHERLAADFADPLAPVFHGAYPAACAEQSWAVAAGSATAFAGAAFRALWEGSGGSWTGAVREGAVAPGARLVFSQESPPLADVIRDINKFSNNVMAREVFLTIGAEATHAPASTGQSARAVRGWLAAHGLAMPELVLENGSGLSRTERISAASLARLLTQVWQGPLAPELVASLPLAGVDGTMKMRPAAPGAHVKTGMLVDVRAVAGFVRAASGRHYAVVALINDPNAGAAQAAHDLFLQWVFERG
jgi:D-alanyl-D-alanine carboxypeptidase/D-alanyl-D-alanine-endopeptidase (penicillin-binding protein 4)